MLWLPCLPILEELSATHLRRLKWDKRKLSAKVLGQVLSTVQPMMHAKFFLLLDILLGNFCLASATDEIV